MSEVAELVERLRHFNAWRRDHDGDLEQPSPRQIGQDIDEACDFLSAMAPVVEAARQLIAETRGDEDYRQLVKCMAGLERALAKLEAANV